jgi:hypothetical protein
MTKDKTIAHRPLPEDDTDVTSVETGAQRDACNDMLLRLAGRLPDELITRCRDHLADGSFAELARAITFSVLSADLALSSADVEALSGLLAETGGDGAALSQVRIDDSGQQDWVFAASPDEDEAQDDPDWDNDGEEDAGTAGGQSQARRPGHELSKGVAEVLAAEPGVVGAWLAWRLASGTESSPPKPVFLVEVGNTADAATTAGRTQRRLAAAGEDSPQVEVYYTGRDLPAYQRMARAYGELVWAAETDPGIQLAPIFDDVDPETGPVFSPDHPLLDDDEARQVAEYLRGGEAVLVTTAQMDDAVNTTRRYCVPMNFRTDGLWVWTEALAYYAERYRLEPDPELLAHIRANEYITPAVDGVRLHRALALLQEPADSEPVWTFGGPLEEPYDEDDEYDEYDEEGHDITDLEQDPHEHLERADFGESDSEDVDADPVSLRGAARKPLQSPSAAATAPGMTS